MTIEQKSASFEFMAFIEDEGTRVFLEKFSSQVKAENCRGKVINIVSFVDYLLSELLIKFSPNKLKATKLTSDLSGCLNSIMNKANVCHMLALLTDNEFEHIKLLANVRNDFAHDWLTDFTSSQVVKRIGKLSSNSNLSSEAKFMVIGGELVTLLHHRLGYAEILNEDLPNKNMVNTASKMAPKRI
ncbi:hypothetical protein [Psychromonas antarctica]|uniref:hypothetical protein n=1 Tax=Psychromonas antarctica TaxID=67573 RepID=UPI001EE94859|nr:hypothetical protein [Psychromonas antarctica]MCG6202915.1 hypothetical protein [Psychromonas antarctica]